MPNRSGTDHRAGCGHVAPRRTEAEADREQPRLNVLLDVSYNGDGRPWPRARLVLGPSSRACTGRCYRADLLDVLPASPAYVYLGRCRYHRDDYLSTVNLSRSLRSLRTASDHPASFLTPYRIEAVRSGSKRSEESVRTEPNRIWHRKLKKIKIKIKTYCFI